ncbi:permease prefix domain 1-containing protein [Gulosibacter chungangensis]|uniref:DUF4293 domain-containing protein n=1 Tax=Gulosibacter chungangensis TaxID=979746 RepID=A0A7J5B771_9MICO|nr:permease prefix domain 1-containing protein [Gulosibacter chungangensis]KAB1640574.1 DUF4293 domain-containing protein [Gulosibacter chungangensis]
MTSTLTDRYISAVVRSLPTDTQTDVQAELAASIADDIDARREQGQSQDEAEREVLTALGDPDALAAGYVDRPLHLIGPKYYLTWWRLLKLLWMIVPITALAGVAIGMALADQPVGEIIGSAISAGIGAFVHVGFWTTLVFFILERSGADTGVKWSVDALPEPQETGAGRGDLIASLVFLGVAAGALLWDRFVGFVFAANGSVDISEGFGIQTDAIPVLNPELWPWVLGIALILIAIEAALAIMVYANRGWRRSFAVLNTVLAIVFAGGALYLLVTGQLINDTFFEFILRSTDTADDVGRILAILLGVTIAGIAIWDIVDGWRKALRRQ